ncbi:hypothetical protein EK904_009296 [Melospiza melodia maxima]|nr:hypothetical protein EK904_009296 [Melospiza melodia maxima]
MQNGSRRLCIYQSPCKRIPLPPLPDPGPRSPRERCWNAAVRNIHVHNRTLGTVGPFHFSPVQHDLMNNLLEKCSDRSLAAQRGRGGQVPCAVCHGLSGIAGPEGTQTCPSAPLRHGATPNRRERHLHGPPGWRKAAMPPGWGERLAGDDGSACFSIAGARAVLVPEMFSLLSLQPCIASWAR